MNDGPNSTTYTAASEDVTLRMDVRGDDIQRIERLVRSVQMFREGEVQVAAELVQERLDKGPASGYEFVLAELPDELVGYTCFGPIACTVASFDLYWIVVARPWQGRGLGRYLLHCTKTRIEEMGGHRIYVETSGTTHYEPTRRFYERCGYVLQARIPDFYAPGDDKLIYCTNLSASHTAASHRHVR